MDRPIPGPEPGPGPGPGPGRDCYNNFHQPPFPFPQNGPPFQLPHPPNFNINNGQGPNFNYPNPNLQQQHFPMKNQPNGAFYPGFQPNGSNANGGGPPPLPPPPPLQTPLAPPPPPPPPAQFSGRKRGWHQSAQDHVSGGTSVKLYVSPVPRTVTEEDIRPVFKPYGCIVEIVLLFDKKTGQQQGSCFVKYATKEEADRAIIALNSEYTFLGEVQPLQVRYADGERERLGAFMSKLYVGCVHKQASKKEIEEIFSPYGVIEEIFLARDELKQSRCAFVKYRKTDMAVAAIKALNGTFVMRGCDHPLVVRFADPRKPKTSDPSGGPYFCPQLQESFARPPPYFGDHIGGCVLPNVSHPIQMQPFPGSWHPPVMPQNATQGAADRSILQQPSGAAMHATPQPSSDPIHHRQIHEASQLPQLPVSDSMKHSLEPQSIQNSEQQQQHTHLSMGKSPQSGVNQTVTCAPAISGAAPTSVQKTASLECDWSQHICPDGFKYYYNCVTLESTWDKPDEFARYEKELEVAEKQDLKLQKSLISQELHKSSSDVEKVHAEAGTIIDPTCV